MHRIEVVSHQRNQHPQPKSPDHDRHDRETVAHSPRQVTGGTVVAGGSWTWHGMAALAGRRRVQGAGRGLPIWSTYVQYHKFGVRSMQASWPTAAVVKPLAAFWARQRGIHKGKLKGKRGTGGPKTKASRGKHGRSKQKQHSRQCPMQGASGRDRRRRKRCGAARQGKVLFFLSQFPAERDASRRACTFSADTHRPWWTLVLNSHISLMR